MPDFYWNVLALSGNQNHVVGIKISSREPNSHDENQDSAIGTSILTLEIKILLLETQFSGRESRFCSRELNSHDENQDSAAGNRNFDAAPNPRSTRRHSQRPLLIYGLIMIIVLVPLTVLGDLYSIQRGKLSFGGGYTIWQDVLVGQAFVWLPIFLYRAMDRWYQASLSKHKVC